jgi:PAS domain S-box-containing protein
VIFDRQGTFRYVSPGLTRIVGWEAPELLGQTWHTFAHPDDLTHIRDSFHQLFERPGQAIVHESRFRHKDGSWRLLEVVGKLHPDGRVVANSRDISERKQAEEALGESEERFRVFVEVSPVGIVLASPEGNIRYASPAYARFAGYTSEELIGQSILSLVHPDEMSHVASLFAEVLQNPDRIIVAEYQHLGKDGAIRIAEATGKVLPNGDIVGFVRDITERKRAEEALRLAERRYRAVFDQPLLSVQVFAADGRALQWNEAYAQLWDVTTPEHIERLQHYNVLDDQALVPFDVTALADKVLTGEPVSIPPTYYSPPVYGGEGRARWVQGFVYPVKDDAGVVREVITLTQDITAQKEAEDQLRPLE